MRKSKQLTIHLLPVCNVSHCCSRCPEFDQSRHRDYWNKQHTVVIFTAPEGGRYLISPFTSDIFVVCDNLWEINDGVVGDKRWEMEIH